MLTLLAISVPGQLRRASQACFKRLSGQILFLLQEHAVAVSPEQLRIWIPPQPSLSQLSVPPSPLGLLTLALQMSDSVFSYYE